VSETKLVDESVAAPSGLANTRSVRGKGTYGIQQEAPPQE
jgi:hypothetical protein